MGSPEADALRITLGEPSQCDGNRNISAPDGIGHANLYRRLRRADGSLLDAIRGFAPLDPNTSDHLRRSQTPPREIVQLRDLLGLLSEGLPVDKTDSGDGPEDPLAFDPKTLAVADRVLAETKVSVWAIEIWTRIICHARPDVGPEHGALEERRSGPCAVRVLEARRSPALVRPACARVRSGRPSRSSPSEPAGRGDRLRAHWAAERAVRAPIPTTEFDAAIAAIRPKALAEAVET